MLIKYAPAPIMTPFVPNLNALLTSYRQTIFGLETKFVPVAMQMFKWGLMLTK